MKLSIQRAVVIAICLALNIQILFSSTVVASESRPVRETMDLAFDWRFQLYEIYNDADKTENLLTGPKGLEMPSFDDRDWRTLHVPHDWSIEGDYDPDHPTRDNSGYVQAGIGWYRKTIEIEENWQGRRLWLEFDGVFRKSTVWVNGVEMGHRPYGWASFGYDITKAVAGKRRAVIAVRVDNSQQNAARWYTGSGIYAPVRLVVTDPVYVAPQGTFIRTEMAGGKAKVRIDTEVANEGEGEAGVELRTHIFDPNGREIVRSVSDAAIGMGATTTFTQRLVVESPLLWSCESPDLYTAVSEVYRDGEMLDRYETRFGIRTIEWRTKTGFWLNGKNVKLKGVCNHQDAGPLGAAVPDKILRFRLKQLKDMGCNAFRTAHNPQTPIFYDMCDEMGVLVMDEIFDGWKRKAPADYGAYDFDEWWRRDLRDWMRRDRNHPSVIIWSVGNETGRSDVPMGKWLVEHCHALDPTRSVTSGHGDPEAMDVFGENGGAEKMGFAEQHGAHLEKPFVATEYPHTWQVRGHYLTQTWYRDGFPNKKQKPFEIPNLTPEEIFFLDWTEPENKSNQKKQIFNSSYDNGMVRISARRAWQQVRDIPWWSGQFRWTGHDYLGEGGYVHGGWPFKAFMGGAIDMCNFEKDLYYLYQSQWTEKPMAHILPHWTHPTMPAGTKIPVWVYSNCDEVELFLNGKSLGREKPGTNWDEMQCEWLVPWTPGEIKAVAYRGGKVAARARQRSAGVPARIGLSTDTSELATDGKDIAQVAVAEQDADGNFYPYGENRVYFQLSGPARLRALGSGSPMDVEPHFGVNSRVSFFGLSKAFVEATRQTGDVVLIAAAILGEKRQITSDRVAIDVRQIALRGNPKMEKIEIVYSTDGSKPSFTSKRYEGPFSVALGTVVRAVVMAGGMPVFDMEERFAEDEGFYWGSKKTAEAQAAKPSESVSEEGGEQAEEAHLTGAAHKSQKGEDFRGSGFVDLPGEGAVTWYLENDGTAAEFDLVFRYAGEDPKKGGRPMKLEINGKEVVARIFLKNTGAWGAQWKTWSTKQRLSQGANQIRLSTLGRGGMNIDELWLKQ